MMVTAKMACGMVPSCNRGRAADGGVISFGAEEDEGWAGQAAKVEKGDGAAMGL
jgi:hypothetical protein